MCDSSRFLYSITAYVFFGVGVFTFFKFKFSRKVICNCLNYRCTEGGILAHFAIRFTKKAKGHMNIFSQAVQAGKIGELEIQPSYIEVSK